MLPLLCTQPLDIFTNSYIKEAGLIPVIFLQAFSHNIDCRRLKSALTQTAFAAHSKGRESPKALGRQMRGLGILGHLSLFCANNLTGGQPFSGCRSSVSVWVRPEGRAYRTISQLPEPQRHSSCLYFFAPVRPRGIRRKAHALERCGKRGNAEKFPRGKGSNPCPAA